MSEYIRFCSSDSRSVYAADIKRIIALPVGAIFRFRYQKHYIDTSILDLIGATERTLSAIKCFVAFSSGNDLEQKEKTQLIHYPIRFANIVKIVNNPDTSLISFYLKLGHFCTLNKTEPYPTTNQFSIEKTQTVLSPSTFINVVRKLEKTQLADSTLIHVGSVTHKKPLRKIGFWKSHKAVKIIDDVDRKKSCFGRLIEGKHYEVHISACSFKNDISYELEHSNDLYLTTKHVRNHHIGLDDFDHTIKVLKSDDEFNRANLSINVMRDGKTDYDVPIDFVVKKTLASALMFGFGVLFSSIGVLLVTTARTNANVAYSFSWLQAIIGGVMVLLATAFLYMRYNKR